MWERAGGLIELMGSLKGNAIAAVVGSAGAAARLCLGGFKVRALGVCRGVAWGLNRDFGRNAYEYVKRHKSPDNHAFCLSTRNF